LTRTVRKIVDRYVAEILDDRPRLDDEAATLRQAIEGVEGDAKVLERSIPTRLIRAAVNDKKMPELRVNASDAVNALECAGLLADYGLNPAAIGETIDDATSLRRIRDILMPNAGAPYLRRGDIQFIVKTNMEARRVLTEVLELFPNRTLDFDVVEEVKSLLEKQKEKRKRRRARRARKRS